MKNHPVAPLQKLVYAILFAPLFLAGCATFSEDGGFDRVEKAVAERGAGRAQWVRTEEAANSVHVRVKELLGQPLSAEGAVQIALLNNPGLQARLATRLAMKPKFSSTLTVNHR